MSTKKMLVFVTLLVVAAFLTACTGETGPAGPAGPAGPEGPAGPAGEPPMAADLSCTECHNDTTIITGKKVAWEGTKHGSGFSAGYAGSRGSCAACHSGGTFRMMVAEGASPATYEGEVSDVTHQDCRTCHEVHSSFTAEDWALPTTDAVLLYAFEDVTYDGGTGNLCGVCHQPRRTIAEADADGNIEVTSTHWGPHHGPQTAVLMGVGGAGDVEGIPSGHVNSVENSCVSCHLGEGDDHSFYPSVASCLECHADIEDFDFSGLVTEVDASLEELLAKLEAADMYHDGHPVVGVYEANKAQAMWNYILLAPEDASSGIHNPAYTKALIEWSLAQFE